MKRYQRRLIARLLGGVCLSIGLNLPGFAQPGAVVAPVRHLAQSYTGMIANTLYRHYGLKYPAPVMTTGMSLRQAGRLQAAFIGRLRSDFGPIVGFKAALTNPAAQERLRVNHPLYGVLLEGMLLESGDTLPVEFGARPVAEGDLMVRVGSEAINTATTDAELLASLDAVIPFMELPDLIYQAGANVDATALAVVNVGARYGVMGEAIPLQSTAEWMARLGDIRVHLKNDEGRTVGTGDSAALLGHPINAVRWLRDTLVSQGITLRVGDVLSLGSITPPVPVEPGTMRLRYFGLHPSLPPERSLDISVTLLTED